MRLLEILQITALLTVANGTPVIAKKLLGRRFARPLDAGATFIDGQPLFGSSKTIRGILVSLVITTASAPLVGLTLNIGAIVAATAMAGDLLSSFVKRRLKLPPSSRALGLDQVPESLLPVLACREALALTALDVALATGIFFLGEIVLSRLLYKIHLRDRPY